MGVYVYVYMYACMHACMCVCVYVRHRRAVSDVIVEGLVTS